MNLQQQMDTAYKSNDDKAVFLDNASEFIKQADLSNVVERLVKVDKWKRKHALQAIEQYKNYLYLRVKYPDKELPPSKEIDDAWHAHILHTSDYFKFCDKVFGYYLHHHPHVVNAERSVEKLKQMFDVTQGLHKKEFGNYIFTIKYSIYAKSIMWLLKRLLKSNEALCY